MLKHIFATIFLICVFSRFAVAVGDEYTANDKFYFYSGVNLLAPFAMIPYKKKVPIILMPALANYEYGLSLAGGMNIKDLHNPEIRLALGGNRSFVNMQFHLVYNFFPLNLIKKKKNIFRSYLGLSCRWWLESSRYSDTDYYLAFFGLQHGWFWTIKKMFIDLRISYLIMSWNWSSYRYSQLEFEFRASPVPNNIRILPLLSCGIGLRF